MKNLENKDMSEKTQKNIQIKNAESGMTGMVFVMLLAVMSSLLVSQIILNQKNANAMHSDLKMDKDVQKKLFLLTLKLKEAQSRAATGNGCEGGAAPKCFKEGTTATPVGDKVFCLPIPADQGGQNDTATNTPLPENTTENEQDIAGSFTDTVTNGTGFCLPDENAEFCEDSEFVNTNGSRIRFCTSLKAAHLKWDDTSFGSGNLNASAQTPAGSTDPSVISNTIEVPAADAVSQRVWKDCSSPGSLCMRVLLCPDDQTSCDPTSAVAYQIVKF